MQGIEGTVSCVTPLIESPPLPASLFFFFVPSEKQWVTITTSDLARWFWPAAKIILELQFMIVPHRFDLLSEKLWAFYKLGGGDMNFYSQITTLLWLYEKVLCGQIDKFKMLFLVALLINLLINLFIYLLFLTP